MFSIDFGEYEMELTRDLFVQLMSNSICAAYPLIENLYASMLMGYPLVEDEFLSLFPGTLAMLAQLERKTEEAGLNAAIKQVRNDLQALLAETNRAGKWVALLLDLSKADLKQMEYYGSLQDVDEEGLPTGDASLPNWVNKEAYQAFLKNSSRLANSVIAGVEAFLRELEIYVDRYGIQYDKHHEQEVLKSIPKLRELIKVDGLTTNSFT